MNRIRCGFKPRRKLLGLCISAALVAPLAPTLVNAAETPAQQEFDIASGNLSSVLNAIARQAGLTLSADPSLLNGKSAQAINGTYTVKQALETILQGSGLQANFSGNTITIGKAPKTSPGNTTSVETKTFSTMTVRGELIERSAQDTHTGVSIVSGEVLDRGIDKDLFDVVEHIPNVSREGGSFGFVIRGIPTGGVAGSGQAISIQVDGMALQEWASLRTGPLGTWDLEQIEILKGPQSTQQGPNAMAGAIIVRSVDPKFEDEVKLRTDFGSFNERRLAVAANTALNDDWAVRIAAEDYRSDGDIYNVITDDSKSAQEHLKTVRGKVRYQPSDQLDVVLGYTHSDNRQADQSVFTGFWPKRQANSTSETTGITDMVNLRAKWDINDNWFVSYDGAYQTNDYLLDIPPGNAIVGSRAIDESTHNQEVKVGYDDGTLRWAAGAYYREEEREVDFKTAVIDISGMPLAPGFFAPPGSTAQFGNTQDNEGSNYAFFGEAEYDLTDQWTVVAGLRYDSNKHSSDSTTDTKIDFAPAGPSPGDIDTSSGPSLSSDFSALLPKAGVVYNFNDDMSAGFTFQRGYRAGGSELNYVGTAYDYDPEYTDNFELSFRSQWLDNRLTFNANTYYAQYKDMQVSVNGPSGSPLDVITENAGKSTMWGVELESSYDLTSEWNVFANLGYAHTRFDDYISITPGAGGAPATTNDYEGNRFAQAPEWTGAIGASYYGNDGLMLSVDGSYTSDSYYTSANLAADNNESYFVMNAMVGYAWDDVSVSMYARNLLDEQYLERRRGDGSSSAGDSRVIGISVNAEF